MRYKKRFLNVSSAGRGSKHVKRQKTRNATRNTFHVLILVKRHMTKVAPIQAS